MRPTFPCEGPRMTSPADPAGIHQSISEWCHDETGIAGIEAQPLGTENMNVAGMAGECGGAGCAEGDNFCGRQVLMT